MDKMQNGYKKATPTPHFLYIAPALMEFMGYIFLSQKEQGRAIPFYDLQFFE